MSFHGQQQSFQFPTFLRYSASHRKRGDQIGDRLLCLKGKFSWARHVYAVEGHSPVGISASPFSRALSSTHFSSLLFFPFIFGEHCSNHFVRASRNNKDLDPLALAHVRRDWNPNIPKIRTKIQPIKCKVLAGTSVFSD